MARRPVDVGSAPRIIDPDGADKPKRKRHNKPPRPGIYGPTYTKRKHIQMQDADQALHFRLAGLSYQQIADRMQLPSRTQASRLVSYGLAAIPAENAKELRSLELAKIDLDEVRLNALLEKKENFQNPETFCKIILAKDRLRQSRAKLAGLNVPQEHEVTLVNKITPAMIRDLSDEQLARLRTGDLSAVFASAGSNGVGGGGSRSAPTLDSEEEGRDPH